MADAGAIARSTIRSLTQSFRLLNLEQKVAAVAALLLIASTFGPFSFIEAAELVAALGVLALLHTRAQGKAFHLPFGDGTAIAAAGIWAGLLIVVRLFDRPLGQNILALACAAILALAGVAERAKRPADDLPPEAGRDSRGAPADAAMAATEPLPLRRRRPRRAPGPAVEEPLAPPEFELPPRGSAPEGSSAGPQPTPAAPAATPASPSEPDTPREPKPPPRAPDNGEQLSLGDDLDDAG